MAPWLVQTFQWRPAVGPPVLRQLCGEEITVPMTGSLFEVRRRVAASLGVQEHQVTMVSNMEEHQVAMLSGSQNADIEKGSGTTQPHRLSDLEMLTDACDVGGELTIVLESCDKELHVGDEVCATQDLRAGDFRIASGSLGTVEGVYEDHGNVKYSIQFPTGRCKTTKETWRRSMQVTKEGSILPQEMKDLVQGNTSSSEIAALVFLSGAAVASFILVPASLYYGGFILVLWGIAFLLMAILWLVCTCFVIFVAFSGPGFSHEARLNKILALPSMAILPMCMTSMWLLAGYGSFGAQMYNVLHRNVTHERFLSLHGNGASGIFTFQHEAPAYVHDTSGAQALPANGGTHQIDIPCHVHAIGEDASSSWNELRVPESSCPWCKRKRKTEKATYCPGYVQLALMPLWLRSEDEALGSKRPAGFGFQYHINVFYPWERDKRNLDEQKKHKFVSWVAPDTFSAFDIQVPAVNAIWLDHLSKNLTAAPKDVEVDSPYDLPAAWIDGFVNSAKQSLGIPATEDLPLLWMPSSAGILLHPVEEQVDRITVQRFWGVRGFMATIACSMITCAFFIASCCKSRLMQRRIQGIEKRLGVPPA